MPVYVVSTHPEAFPEDPEHDFGEVEIAELGGWRGKSNLHVVFVAPDEVVDASETVEVSLVDPDGEESDVVIGRTGDRTVLVSASCAPDAAARLRIADALAVSRYGALTTLRRAQATTYRLADFDRLAGVYLEAADRMVNYTSLDDRVFDLARTLRKRLAEFDLKRRELALEADALELDWRAHEEGRLFELTREGAQVFRGPLRLLWLGEDLVDLANGFESQAADAESAANRLQGARELVEALTSEASDRASDAMNTVLYWLGIITLFIGLAAMVDKYLSADTFGMAPSLGLTSTMAVVVPFVLLFLFTMVKHGAALRFISEGWRSLRLRALELVLFGWFGYSRVLIGVKGRWVGRGWMDWYEWRLTELVDCDLRSLANPVVRGSIELSEEVEEHAIEQLAALWDDLEFKSNELFGEGPRWVKGARAGFDALWRHTRLAIATDFLRLELPRPCPSLPVLAMMYWKTPLCLFVPPDGPGESTLRQEVLDAQALFYEDCPFETVWEAFQSTTLGLVRELWPEAPASDEEAWAVFRTQFLDGEADLEHPLVEAADDAEAELILEAYRKTLGVIALSRAASRDDGGLPEHGGEPAPEGDG